MSSQKEEEWGKKRSGVLVGPPLESITVPTLGQKNRHGGRERENKREGTRGEQETCERCVCEREIEGERVRHTYTHVGMCCGDINGVPSRSSPSVSVWEHRFLTQRQR